MLICPHVSHCSVAWHTLQAYATIYIKACATHNLGTGVCLFLQRLTKLQENMRTEMDEAVVTLTAELEAKLDQLAEDRERLIQQV